MHDSRRRALAYARASAPPLCAVVPAFFLRIAAEIKVMINPIGKGPVKVMA